MASRTEPDSSSTPSGSRAFVLRIRPGHGSRGKDLIVTLDDIETKQKNHFTTLEAAFAEIRKALNLPIPKTGKPH